MQVYEKKLKTVTSTIPSISTKGTTPSHLKLVNTKRAQHVVLGIQIMAWYRLN
jgi:hypothetical protein